MLSSPAVVLVDLNNALYRYYHTQNPITYNNQRMECVYSILKYIKRLSEGEVISDVGKVIVVADHKDKSFRGFVSPTYKSNRSEMDEELRSQESIIHEALSSYGFPLIKKAGVEADDSIGMLATYYGALGKRVVIVATDKDYHQLIDENISIYNPMSKTLYDVRKSEEKMLVTPNKVADLLALMGDKTDGINGIPGVGAKTAAKWLNQYGDLGNVIANSNDINGVVGESLRSNLDLLITNKSLTKIVTDQSLLLKSEIDLCNFTEPDMETYNSLKKMYKLNLDSAANGSKGFSLGFEEIPISAYEQDALNYSEAQHSETEFFF
jgi:DNA polymerase-1